ncbi:MAG: N5-glutamine S-adenosyl-L-methionine-dependent methyltransferase [Methanosaeta sp. PtaU1.Bin112]|nr:MAG: N5-glutamine S-adenosyl-L-methionine-dependent methyltransferase [Methanosaeta sp. PtaU1.Bin112]
MRCHIYPPSEDTFLLLRAALSEAGPEDRLLEIGCGCGLISQELRPRVSLLLATDINPHAVRAARARGVEVIRADLFAGIKGRFDLVLFNAPYLPTLPEERTGHWIDRALDGGESGRETVDRFIADLSEHLRPGGRALLLISSLTGLAEVRETAEAAGLWAEVVAEEGCFFERLYVLRLGTISSSL